MPDTVPAGDPRGVGPVTPDAPENLSDPELIAATRGGDTTAYAVLYERHVHAARRLARVLAQDTAAADDLVSETFAKLLHAFREGQGPDLAFRPYMLRTLRNTFYDRVRRDKRIEYTDDLTKHDSGEIFVDPAVEGAERRYAALAFGKLPERWQMVLWHTEVEQDPPAKVASMLGMTANGVSALAYRAREKLRQNYLTEHAADSPPEECRWTVDRLGARVRGKLGVRDAEKVDDHLDGCVSCNLLFAELTELNSGLRGVVGPIVLGAASAPYLAAGVASAAGIAVGGVLGAIAAPFTAVANWIRRIFQQLGTKGSIATGTAAAVVAAAAVFALTSGEPEQEPEAAAEPPSSSAEPEDEPAEEQDDPADPDDPLPDPDDPPAEPEPGDSESPAPEEPADEPEDEPAEPASYGIEHDLGSSGLTAGGESVLPIRLNETNSGGGYAPTTQQVETFPESAEARPIAHGQAASTRITLDIELPEGVELAAEEAAPGWTCEKGDGTIECAIGEMPDPAVAEVRIRIADHVSGYQTFTVTVDGPEVSGTSELRIPVAPSGSEVGYASLDATGVTASGNTWMTCAIPACREATAIGVGDRYPMKPYKSPHGHPQPPAGQEGEAVSGAHLDIPGGAEIVWAGVYWAGVDDDLPTEVSLAGPGGSWTDLGADEVTGTSPGAQAFADVTDLVAGGGEYWVAVDNHALPTSDCHHWPAHGGDDCLDRHWAGWSLTVVYDEPGAEKRDIAVYDGAPASDTEIEVRGGGEVTAAYTLWGGSGYDGGDRLSIGGRGMGEPATCTAHGAVNNPRWYTFGVDVGVETASVGEESTVAFYHGSDEFVIGVVAIAAPSG
ncbi:sigma-70 family RNA polymerase sigma factor [Glycomyces salinus]|uniref:sigma-70 family RNA polymerase sigma factor n=1 Tax=Glycomyces salinus TaxID=980294 RepID=UPI0018ED2469|nr:sigma-70 family RNA polymerase sigma factor [Glycomyces salinus]